MHPGYFEAAGRPGASGSALYHHGAYVLEVGETHRRLRAQPPLALRHCTGAQQPLGALPEDADTYYIHDIALLPLARKVGAASHIVEGLIKHAIASGFPSISLIAVNGSLRFWYPLRICRRGDRSA